MARHKNPVKRRLYGLRLDEKLITALRHAALDKARPANQVLEDAIREWLKAMRRADSAPA
jgi:hypothetical protein